MTTAKQPGDVFQWEGKWYRAEGERSRLHKGCAFEDEGCPLSEVFECTGLIAVPCDPPSPPAPTLLDEAIKELRRYVTDHDSEWPKCACNWCHRCKARALLHRYDSGER